MNKENWIEVGTADAWSGEGEIQGIYVSKNENVGANESTMYMLKTKDGLVGVWDTTVIHSKMSQIPIGSEVLVKSVGKKKGKNGREYKDYVIMYRPAPFEEVKTNDEPLPPEQGEEEMPF